MYIFKVMCCLMYGMILNNALLTAQVNVNYIHPKSQILKGNTYYLSKKTTISSKPNNSFDPNPLRSAIQGARYAIIELTPIEQDRANKGENELVVRMAQYLRKVGFTHVAYETTIKNKLILSVPTYCDLVRVRFQMKPKGNYFEQLQMSFRTCNNAPIHINYAEKLERNPEILDNIENLWFQYFDEYTSYNIQQRLQLDSYPVTVTKKEVYNRLKNNKALLDSIEGIFEKVPQYNYNEKKHTIAILKNSEEGYNIVYLDGASNYLDWKEGEWMGEIKAQLHNGIFNNVKWAIPNKALQKDVAIQLKEDKLILKFKNHNEYIYRKLNSTQTLINSVGLDGKGAAGSGVLIDKRGFILTSYNVVGNGSGKNIMVVLPKLDNQLEVDINAKWFAKVIEADPKLDLALLQVENATFNYCDGIPYQFESKEVDIGEKVFTLGYPLVSSMGMHPKLAVGAISSVRGYKNAELSYQTSVQVYAGNSGSPLFDYQGKLLGLLKNKHSEASKASYALKSSSILQFLQQTGLFDTQELVYSPNTLEGLPLTEQIKQLQPFVFYIYSD